MTREIMVQKHMMKIFRIFISFLALTMSAACFSCDLNPGAKNKCPPKLMAMYSPVIKKWQADSKNEDSALSSSDWPEAPACLNQKPVDPECRSVRDVMVSVTELPQAQVVSRTFAATLIGCSGISGSSCHLYHRVYLIVENTNEKGEIEYALCSELSCP